MPVCGMLSYAAEKNGENFACQAILLDRRFFVCYNRTVRREVWICTFYGCGIFTTPFSPSISARSPDLSLAEIAEQKGCSRQSVSDTLNKARRQMEEYEEKLRFSRLLAESALAQSLMAENINRWARENLSEEACAHILSLTQRDYSEEAKKRAEENREKQG